MKLVHAADLHLDSPLRGLERYEGAPVDQIRGATRRALENLIDLCLEQRAEVLLVAGDLYDGNWRDYSTGLFLVQQLARLREAGTRVVLVRGNHDAASQITRHLKLPENAFELSCSRPETRRFDELGIAVHGQGFAKRAVTSDLAKHYPDPLDGYLNVGLLHTCLTGREGHESYAPTEVETLASRGYDYWALGHVHERDVVSTEPWIVFSGNLQGRHAKETGAKGATVITAEDQRIVDVSHFALDVVRWAVCEIDATEAASIDDLIDLSRSRLEELMLDADGRTVAARVVFAGPSPAHGPLVADPERWENEIRAAALDVAGDQLWVERVRAKTTTPMDLDAVARRTDALGQVVRALRAARTEPGRLEALLEELAPLRSKLPPEVRDGPDGIRLDDPETILEALADIEQTILPRLAGAERGDA